MEFIDTHTHTYDEAFDGCEDEVIARAEAAGVSTMLEADIDSRERGRMLALTARHPGVLRHMIGLYPGSVRDDWRDEIDALEAARTPDAVAVGEIGLDYHYGKEFAEQQKEALERQIRMAIDRDLPLSIHCRDAFPELFDVLFKFRGQDKFRGVIHSFSGTHDDALRLLSLDTFMFGVNGTVTFRKSGLPAVLRSCVPAGRVLLETDCPYLAPVPYRGRRNESAYVVCVLRKLAEIYDLPEEVIARQTTENALALFGRL